MLTLLPHPLHANSVVFQEKGILIIGESSSGKSDLSLRLINAGATLICDDYSYLSIDSDVLMAYACENISGKLEVRGVGIINTPYIKKHPIHCAIELSSSYQRYPEKEFFSYENCKVRKFMLNPFEISVIDKIKIILEKF